MFKPMDFDKTGYRRRFYCQNNWFILVCQPNLAGIFRRKPVDDRMGRMGSGFNRIG